MYGLRRAIIKRHRVGMDESSRQLAKTCLRLLKEYMWNRMAICYKKVHGPGTDHGELHSSLGIVKGW